MNSRENPRQNAEIFLDSQRPVVLKNAIRRILGVDDGKARYDVSLTVHAVSIEKC